MCPGRGKTDYMEITSASLLGAVKHQRLKTRQRARRYGRLSDGCSRVSGRTVENGISRSDFTGKAPGRSTVKTKLSNSSQELIIIVCRRGARLQCELPKNFSLIKGDLHSSGIYILT